MDKKIGNLNEASLKHKVKMDLRKLGLPIIREKEIWRTNPKRRADVVAYSVDREGNLTAEVVVEIKLRTSPDMQRQLQEAAKKLGSTYALLVVGTDYYWYDGDTFLPIAAPEVIKSTGQYLIKEEDILNKFWTLFNYFQGSPYISYDHVLFLGHCLVTRAYLGKTNKLEQWGNLINREDYFKIMRESLVYYGLEFNEFMVRKIDDNLIKSIVNELRELPPTDLNLGRAFMESAIEMIFKNSTMGQFFEPRNVRNLLNQIIRSLRVRGGTILNLTTGVGTVLYELIQAADVDKYVALEFDQLTATIAKIVTILSGEEKVEIYNEDALLFKQNKGNYKLVSLDPPLKKLKQDEFDRYSHYELIKNRGHNLELADLFIEHAINMVEQGGHIIALVPESILFKTPGDARKLIRNKTYIEGIISLPMHTFKPYTAVKMSILILRKKKDNEPEPKDLFLGAPESVDAFPEIAEAFTKWKRESDS